MITRRTTTTTFYDRDYRGDVFGETQVVVEEEMLDQPLEPEDSYNFERFEPPAPATGLAESDPAPDGYVAGHGWTNIPPNPLSGSCPGFGG